MQTGTAPIIEKTPIIAQGEITIEQMEKTVNDHLKYVGSYVFPRRMSNIMITLRASGSCLDMPSWVERIEFNVRYRGPNLQNPTKAEDFPASMKIIGNDGRREVNRSYDFKTEDELDVTLNTHLTGLRSITHFEIYKYERVMKKKLEHMDRTLSSILERMERITDVDTTLSMIQQKLAESDNKPTGT